jgi:HMG (high mobility group) box
MSLQSAIVAFVQANPSISKKDFLKMVGDNFSEAKGDLKKKTKKSSSSDSDAPAKPLNAYQVFVKEQMTKLKEDGSSATGKELMKEIGVLWKAHKAENDSSSDPEPEVVGKSKKGSKKSEDSKKDAKDSKKDAKDSKKDAKPAKGEKPAKGSVGGFKGKGVGAKGKKGKKEPEPEASENEEDEDAEDTEVEDEGDE